jgi:hypothetical protein
MNLTFRASLCYLPQNNPHYHPLKMYTQRMNSTETWSSMATDTFSLCDREVAFQGPAISLGHLRQNVNGEPHPKSLVFGY